MNSLEHILTVLTLLSVGALVGGGLYDGTVLARNLRGGAGQLEHGRQFMASATPSRFFRVLSPASQLLVLLSLVAHWFNTSTTSSSLLLAFFALIICDLITFKFHYPRNALMFTAPLEVPAAKLHAAARQWAAGNHVRILLVIIAWIATLNALPGMNH